MRQSRLLRAGALTMAASVLTLAINLVTGVIVARRLDAFGRGEVTAIITLMQFSGLLFTVGARPAIAYRVAKHPDETGLVLASWLAVLPLLWLGAAVAAELALPTLFAAQQAHELALARVFVLMAGLIPAGEMLTGALLGSERFTAWNVVKLAQPLTLVAVYAVLLVMGDFTVMSALVANTVSIAAVPLAAGAIVLRGRGGVHDHDHDHDHDHGSVHDHDHDHASVHDHDHDHGSVHDHNHDHASVHDHDHDHGSVRSHRLSRPRLQTLKTTMSYGLRSHATAISSLVNFRLDLVVMPAILPAREIGFYAVAVSVSSVVVATTGTLAYLVLPAAVSRGDRGPETVIMATLASIIVGAAIATVIALTAALLIPAVYGPQFRSSVTPLLLLLPGSILIGPGSTLSSGLESLGRPGRGSLPPLVGAVVTVVGLTQFLGSGGAAAAALVSTVSYTTVFAVGSILFLRSSQISLGEAVKSTHLLRTKLPERKGTLARFRSVG